MQKVCPVINKSDEAIAHEWDNLAKNRIQQIKSGKDLSYNNILIPSIFNLSKNCDFFKVLDVGCGTGVLTNIIAKKAINIDALDISEISIQVAKKNSDSDKINYINSSIESYASTLKNRKYTLVIANMTLMDILSLDKALKSIAQVLKPEGAFVFTITHPCFWQFYWGYNNESWFNYKNKIGVEGNFNISLDEQLIKTTHIHRPLEIYINCLISNGFTIDKVIEPMPNKELELKYPKPWSYPRFLGMRCVLK